MASGAVDPPPLLSSPRGSDVLSRYKQAKLAAGRPSGSRAARAHRQCQTFCHEVCFHWGQLNKSSGPKHSHVLVHSTTLINTRTSEHTQDNLLYFLPKATVSASCLCCLCLCLRCRSVLQSMTSFSFSPQGRDRRLACSLCQHQHTLYMVAFWLEHCYTLLDCHHQLPVYTVITNVS